MHKTIRWEIKAAWRSFRIPGFWLLLLFFALLDPPMIKYMETIITRFGGGVKIQVPPPTAQLAFVQFLQDLSQISSLVLILLVAGSVAAEKKSGLACWYLAQPLSRGQYLISKWLAHFILLQGGVLGAGIISYLYTWTLLGTFPFGRALLALVGSFAFLLFLMSATYLGSALFSTAGAGVFGIVLGYGGYLFSGPAKALGVYRFFPQSLPGSMAAIVAGTYPSAELYPAIIACIVLSGVFLGLACVFFQRMELSL